MRGPSREQRLHGLELRKMLRDITVDVEHDPAAPPPQAGGRVTPIGHARGKRR